MVLHNQFISTSHPNCFVFFDMLLDVAKDCLLHNINIANGAYAKLVVAKYQWTTHRDGLAVKGNLQVCFATIQIDVATNFGRIATNNR